MRTLLCILVLLLAPAVPAVSGSPAPPPVPVMSVSVDSLYDHGGTLYFGGTRIDSLWSLAMVDSQVVVNGYTLEVAALSAQSIVPTTPEAAAMSNLITIGERLIAEGRSRGESDQHILEAWRDSCQANPNVVSVRISTHEILIRGLHGQTVYRLPGDPSAVVRHASRAKVNADLLLGIQEALKAGCIVWITQGGIDGIPPTEGTVSQFESALAKVRRGEALTPAENRLLPESAKQLARQPIRMIRTL